jgi:SDR family mycofactocin-dependent oxidoreductase
VLSNAVTLGWQLAKRRKQDMGLLDSKVAFITGIARGQGRSHALTLAREGADIIGLDLCEKLDSTVYPGSTLADLQETVRLVEEAGGRIVAEVADVRDLSQVEKVFQLGIEKFGHVDFVVANAGIFASGKFWEIEADAWREMLDINLTGVWNTVRTAAPSMIARNQGGSIVITGSTESLKGMANTASYSAAKHGVTGLMRTMANELGEYGIRVNTVNPTCVDTNMIQNEGVYRLFQPQAETPTRESVAGSFAATNVIPVPWIEPADVSQSILWLLSDASRYITGAALPVDAGFTIK